MKKIGWLALVLVALMLLMVPAYSDEIGDYEDEKSSIEENLDTLANRKAETKEQINGAISENKGIIKLKNGEKIKYNKMLRRITNYEASITETENQILDLEKQYAARLKKFKKRLVLLLKEDDYSFLSLFLESSSMSEAYEKMDLLNVIAEKDAKELKWLNTTKEDIEGKKAVLERKKETVRVASVEVQDKIKGLDAESAKAQENIAKYNAVLQNIEDREDELILESERIEREIRELQAEAARKAAEEANNNTGGNYDYSTPPAGGITGSGQYAWPCPSSSAITSVFGMRVHPVTGVYKLHTGVDIGGGMGSAIVAAESGTVISAGFNTAYGNCIIIDHGSGMSTLYAHASAMYVGTGAKVQKGQTIAAVGSTGYSTGAHLHFEVRVNGSPVNPMSYI